MASPYPNGSEQTFSTTEVAYHLQVTADTLRSWTRRFGRFDAGGDLSKRALRFSLGLIVVLILWFGLGQIFPRNEDVLSFVLRFARYALLGAWVSAGAPWVFVRLKLANGPALAKTGK